MGFLAPVVPYIPQIAGAIGGIFAGKAATNSAMSRSPEERSALGGAGGAAGTLTGMGSSLSQTALPYIQNAGNYYQTLLSGNRGAMSAAVAGPTAQLTDQYAGAQTGLQHSGLRGAARDMASANLTRDMAGRVAGLTTGVQPAAASALAGLGQSAAGLGINAAYSGGSIYDRLLGAGFQNRMYGRQQGEEFGQNFGSLLFDILRGTTQGTGGGGMSQPRPGGTGLPIGNPYNPSFLGWGS